MWVSDGNFLQATWKETQNCLYGTEQTSWKPKI